MEKNIVLNDAKIECITNNCGFMVTISPNEYASFLNVGCPKCGKNLLNQEDYDSIQRFMARIKLVNGIDLPKTEKTHAAYSADGHGNFDVDKLN